MLKKILTGLLSYRDSFKLINELKLWPFFFVPMAISLLFGIAIFFAAYGLSDHLGRFFAKAWVWEWGSKPFTSIATWLGALVILILGFILYKHLVMALSAPFMSPVSERIEKYLYPELHHPHTHRKTSNTQQLIRSLRINIRNLFYEIGISIPLLILSLIPVVNFVTTPLLFFVQAYYAGFGNMDYTLERHYEYSDSVSFIKKNKGYAIGNGIIFMALLFIPVVGIILVLPVAVTAASTTTLKLLKEQHIRMPHQQ